MRLLTLLATVVGYVGMGLCGIDALARTLGRPIRWRPERVAFLERKSWFLLKNGNDVPDALQPVEEKRIGHKAQSLRE